MNPASKHLDPVVGIDIHIVQPPGLPPVPIPHPFVGIVLDLLDYVPVIGSTVTIGGLPRSQASTGIIEIPPHIPIGGTFIKPPGNEGEVFMGSSSVVIDGEPATYLALPALSCQDIGVIAPIRPKKRPKTKSMVLPLSMVLAIPSGVVIGGSPTISLAALGMRAAFGAALRALGGLLGKVRKLRQAGRARRAQNGVQCNAGHPVDVITGAQFDRFVDAKAGDGLFCWERYYSTTRASRNGPLGFGFRHSYQHVVRISSLFFRYETPQGAHVDFLPLAHPGDHETVQGYELRRLDARRLELQHGDTTIELEVDADGRQALPRWIYGSRRALELQHEAGRLTRAIERGASGQTRYRFSYDEGGRIVALDKTHQGRSHALCRYAYDGHGCMAAAKDAGGGEHRYEYDRRRLMIRMRDPRGYEFWWRYDDGGRCVESSGQDGLWWCKLQYDPTLRETRVTERGGGVWIHRYDENGTLRERVDPYGGKFERQVDQEGRVVREVDSGGRAMTWLYDEAGVHTGRLDDLGNSYPPELEMPRLPDPMAPRWPMTAVEREWGELAQRPVPAGPAARAHDQMGRLVAETDHAGRQRAWGYDVAGNKIWHRDADGREHHWAIASWNLVGAQLDPLGNYTRYEHTAAEKISLVVDPGGASSEYTYDEKDRLVRVRRHGRVREEYVYDEGDRLVEKRSAAGDALLKLEYDERSLVKARHLARGGTHALQYDVAGRPVQASTDQHQVTLTRDRLGLVCADTVDGKGVEHEAGKGEGGTRRRRSRILGRFVIEYEMDPDPPCVVLRDPTGGCHRLEVDPQGRVLRQHPSGTRELTHYDDQGRCIERVARRSESAAGTAVRQVRYAYSPEGDLLFADDIDQGRVTYTFDAAHRLAGESALGYQHEYRLDAAGNLVGKPGLANVVMISGNLLARANGEVFSYNVRDHLAERRRFDGMVTRYFYDSLDMLVRVEDGKGEPWTAAYDALGRRLWCGRGDRQTSFYWDDERLAAELDAEGRLRIYAYASRDALVPLLLVDYDDVEAPPESGRVYALFCNQAGVPTTVEDAAGRVVWRAARVDPYGAVEVDPASEIDVRQRWPGHHFDAETGLHYNRYRYYDPVLGRYLQSDPMGQAGGINLYAYAPNPLVDVDVLGLTHAARGNASSGQSGSPRPHVDSPHSPDAPPARPPLRDPNAGWRRGQVPCFPAGTLVATPDGPQRIESLRLGTLVYAYDFGEDAVVMKHVLAVSQGSTRRWIDVHLGVSTVRATRGHRFWVESAGGWIDAEALRPGMTVHLMNGTRRAVESVEVVDLVVSAPTFNLSIESTNNFFAGDVPVLVHNGAPAPDEPGHSNYVIWGVPRDRKGKLDYDKRYPIYTGRFGPNERQSTVEARHLGEEFNPTPETARYNPAGGDWIEVLPGTRTYAEARRLEHEICVRHGIWIGRVPGNYRGNRDYPMQHRKFRQYYPLDAC